MTELAAGWVALLADWSLRWGVLILGLMLVFALRPPRAVAARLWLARLVLVGGLLLPLSPHWWAVSWPRVADSGEAAPVAAPAASESVLAPQADRPADRPADGRGVRVHPPPSASFVPDVPTAPASLPSAESVTAPPAAEPQPVARPSVNWPVVLAVGWLAGCGLFLVRLAAGRWWLARVRRAATPIDGELLGELEEVRDELGVRRPIAFLMSPAVAGPALFGGRRPAVVVPPDWATVPAADRRAALLHELTHVARGDDWAALAEELVRAVFFFHPLVHWLLARLAREREQRCDAAVVRHGVAPLALARVLFDGARRLGVGRSVLARPAIPMAHRSTVAVRIHQLLEADMTRWSEPLSKDRAARAAVVVLALCAGLGGLGTRTATPADAPADPPQTPPKAAEPAKSIRGSVKDSAGNAVAGATVVAGGGDGSGERLVTKTDAGGRFSFDRFPVGQDPIYATAVVAVKDGFAPVRDHASPLNIREVVITLPDAAEYKGTVKDQAGRPVAGAEVQFGVVGRDGNVTFWGYAPANHLRGTPAEPFFLAKTDASGAFKFTTVPAGAELIFRASAPGFAETDTGAGGPKRQHVVGPDAKPAELTLQPEAVLRGRVASKVPGAVVKDLLVRVKGTGTLHGLNRSVKLGADGRFEFRTLPAGELKVFIVFPAGVKVAAAGATITPKAGETVETNLEVIEGIEVTGVVRVKGGGPPIPGASVVAAGSFSPTGHDLPAVTTDAEGRFRLHVPPGEATVSVWACPPGFAHPSNQWEHRKVSAPAAGGSVKIEEPFELIRVVEGLTGRVTDAAGKPMPHVKVSALQHSSVCGNFATTPVSTSHDGQFTLPYSPNGPLEVGRSVPLRVETSDGKRFEAAALVLKEGVAEVRVPTLIDAAGPQDVKPNEFAGRVVDENGKPLAGVKVHVWDWVDSPENYTFSGPDGVFRLKDCDPKKQIQVRFKKDGYSPVMIVRQEVGVKGFVVAMDRATYFEGVVRGPDGKPAAGATVRADQGPKMLDGGVYTEVWTETTADAQGKYCLYVQPDEYAFHVKAAGVGVARLPKAGIANGQARAFDIRLQPGITFRARVIDSVSGKPVAGLRLFDWQQKALDARSNANGEVTLTELLPGEFTFNVESETHARWWSDQCTREWERKWFETRYKDWQRNFDGLTFDLKAGMATVTIVAEPAVRVTGRVLDPDGKPVGGATAAPAFTGSGNSLTGDTRFSVETKPDGTFDMKLPASGAVEYNLVVHDGKYGEWRKWANGVLPPIKTTPGQVIDNVTLSLTRPAVVRGKVVDEKGKPVAGREVRSHAADLLENRYYDPTTTTKPDGTFELKFVRPAEQFVQVAPFWLFAKEAPSDSTKKLTLKPGEVVEGVTLVAAPERER
jgi:protocatechuate 3,4-dioxygenase beta subunit